MSEKKYVPIQLKEVDLKDYGVDIEKFGREGTLKIRPRTSMIQAKLASFLAKLAREAGIELNEGTEEQLAMMYLFEITTFLLKECLIVPVGEPPITDEELMYYPDELIDYIGGVIGDGDFPLDSSPGEGSKNEE